MQQLMTLNVIDSSSSLSADKWPLPTSQTCFFIVDIPRYKDVVTRRTKLLASLDCTDINF